MFIYLLCQAVANWAYLRIGGSSAVAACSHVSCARAERSTLFFRPPRRAAYAASSLLFAASADSRLQGYNIRRERGEGLCRGPLQEQSHNFRRSRPARHPSLATIAPSGVPLRARDRTSFFFSAARLAILEPVRSASPLSPSAAADSIGVGRCIASFRAVGHLIHFPRTRR